MKAADIIKQFSSVKSQQELEDAFKDFDTFAWEASKMLNDLKFDLKGVMVRGSIDVDLEALSLRLMGILAIITAITQIVTDDTK